MAKRSTMLLAVGLPSGALTKRGLILPADALPAKEATLVRLDGSTRDGRWQIGWCELDEACREVIARPSEPLIGASRNAPGQRELAFAASAFMVDQDLYVYYSIGDTDPARARVRWHR